MGNRLKTLHLDEISALCYYSGTTEDTNIKEYVYYLSKLQRSNSKFQQKNQDFLSGYTIYRGCSIYRPVTKTLAPSHMTPK
jgi:truncated hemoglobin YjbI